MSIDTAQQVAPVLPAPTLDGDGNPTQPWPLTSTTRTGWGTQRVWIDGVDVTEYGAAGKRTTWFDRWSFVKPHWFGDATIRVTKVRSYATPPSWCAVGKEVRLRHLLPDGDPTVEADYNTDPRSEWRGKVARVVDGDAKTTTLECTGWYQIADWYTRSPVGGTGAIEIGDVWAANLAPSVRPQYPWPNDPTAPTTTKTSTVDGDWQSPLEYLASIGAALPLWTWRPADSTYTPAYVDTSVSPGSAFTLRHGTPGVDAELVSDLRTQVNAIYVTGFANGKPWELKTVDVATGATQHAPISADPRVNTLWWNDTTGAIDVDDTLYDPSIPRIEVHWQLPAGMGYTEAKAIADQFRAAVAGPPLTGSVRLSVSPVEMHLLDTRPDDICTYQGYRGDDRTLYVGEVSFDWNNGTPTCEAKVDASGRDLASIEAVLAGDIEAATNPFARSQAGRTEGQTDGRLVKWSTEAGSGSIPNDDTNGHRHKDGVSTVTLNCDRWNELVGLFSEQDSVTFTKMVCSDTGAPGVGDGREFYVIVTDQTVPLPPDIDSPLPVDPSAVDAMDQAVADDATHCQESFGGTFRMAGGSSVNNPCGYGNPANQGKWNGDALTGLYLDMGQWSYSHDNPDMQPGPGNLAFYVFPVGDGSGTETTEFYAETHKGPER